MSHNYAQIILERLGTPGWITTRGVLRDPTGQADPDDYLAVEEIMKELAAQGTLALWSLTIDEDGSKVLAAARPDLELDEELKNRGAAAKAVRYQVDDAQA